MLIILGAVLATAITVGGIAFSLYDRATHIDRSTPASVMEQYIGAVFEDRSASKSVLFVCSRPDLHEVDQLLSTVKSLEKRYSINVEVKVVTLSASTHGDSSVVQTGLAMDVPEANGVKTRSTSFWRFDLRNESGWRVCGAHRLS